MIHGHGGLRRSGQAEALEGFNLGEARASRDSTRYADGTSQTVDTDGTWKTADGPTMFDDVYTGEKYDARLLQAGWEDPRFDERRWTNAMVMSPPQGFSTQTGQPIPAQLTAQENPPVRVLQTLRPISITKLAVPGPDTYVLDFGQIVTGWPHLTVRGQPGTTVSLDYDESLNADGTVHQGVGSTFIDGRYSTSYYTLSGRGTEQWSPSFGYTGFRYVEVTGLPTAPTMADPKVTAEVARSDNPVTGDVTTSNALLNQILQNAKWSPTGQVRNGTLRHSSTHGRCTSKTVTPRSWTACTHRSKP
jgi:alpha-L-rhamnosidase